MPKFSKSLLPAALGISTLFAVGATAASANYLARCQTRSGSGYAEACGVNPQEARRKCFEKLPDLRPVLLGISTSNCSA